MGEQSGERDGRGGAAEPVADGLVVGSLVKRFGRGGPLVVDDVSLRVGPGEVVAVMGRSGSGKSTLLRCAAGLEPVSSGSVRWRGRELARASARSLARLRRSDLAVVHQDYNLLPALTVGENVELSSRLAGRRPAGGEVAAALEAVGLDGRGRARPGELSGGQQQRVALARALVVGASLVLADEPTAALDAGNRDVVLDLLCRLVEGGGRSVLVVTHDPWVAARADRVLFMADGRVHSALGRSDARGITEHLEAVDAASASDAA